jgi:hypothetical protein
MQCDAVWCRQACGSRKEWWAAPDPSGLATATPACGPPCANRPRGFTYDPRCSTQSLQGIRRHGMASSAVKPHGAWATGPYWLTSRDPLGSLGSKELNLGKEATDAARSTPVQARRRRRGGGTRLVVGCLLR